ncbi:hypothetical protein [Paludisphaera mucosa]|uniref:PsbP C-terminal domain-containing protein n=1 Tax=Paludisphaera mucosa TaxID=3030827 RepID=A0ABT6F5E2_9BACT|nr:hypothetical protein [Paludisphaera mucosa]MDG3002711.1 hypothetical protein [Paludisphaera mucosa]
MNSLRSETARRWSILAAGLAAVAALAAADDPKTQTIEARGLTFQAPAGWKKIATTSQMRAAQLRVDPIKGDDFPADLVVYVFPGGAGSVDANVERWKKQFKGADGKEPEVETKKVEAKGVEASRVEISGLYHPTAFPGMPVEPDRPNARLLGAIVVTDKFGYFLKMVGPDKTMKEISPQFDELIKTLDAGGK